MGLEDKFGPLFIGEAKIILPSSDTELSPEEEIEMIATEALRQVRPLIGSEADIPTEGGDTYRELNAALKRLKREE